MMRRAMAPRTLALVLALATAGAARPPAVTPPGESSTAPLPFARVYLALRGCTSCSHCRTAIRQLVRAQAGSDGEARVDGDRIEVIYRKPVPIPLRKVIRGLAESRLHDLSLVDVLLEATGTVSRSEDGSTRFTLWDTQQSFPISIDRAVRHPADRAPVRLIALVEGWRGRGEISLVARKVGGD